MAEATAYPEGRTLGGVLVEMIGALTGCPRCGEPDVAVAPDLETFECPRCHRHGDTLDVAAYLDEDVLLAVVVRLKLRCETIAELRAVAAWSERGDAP